MTASEPAKKSRSSARAALRNKLEQRLATLPYDTPLPPMRELMQEYRVGTTKLNTVISQLEEDGLLVRKARSGIYKAKDHSNNISVPFIDVVLCGMILDDTDITEGMGMFTGQLISELTTTISKQGRGCRIHKLSDKANLTKYRELVASSGMKASILVYQNLPDISDMLDENNIAWVSLLPKIHLNTSCVIEDSPNRTKLELDYLFKLGHTKIAYMDDLDHRAYCLSAVLWRESFYKIMANHHLEVRENWVQTPGFTEDGIRKSLEAIFESKPYPTALLARDYDLPIAYRFVESLGLEPGKEISFIAHNDLPFVCKLHPAGTSVVNSPAIAAKMALKTLTQIMAGNNPEQLQHIPLSIVERESTSPALK